MGAGTTTWRDETIVTAILYRVLERGERLPLVTVGTDYEFIDKYIDRLHSMGILAVEGDYWGAGKEAKSHMADLISQYDQVIKFEVFSNVLLDRPLTENECQEVPPGADAATQLRYKNMVRDHLYDPRFVAPTIKKGEDLRLAVISFLDDILRPPESGVSRISLHKMVTIQKLIDGEWMVDQNFWANFRTIYLRQVEEIVDSAYKWQSTGATEDEAKVIMEIIYTSGMVEIQKRNGQECGKCGIPLAILQQTMNEGKSFEKCPNPECGVDFRVIGKKMGLHIDPRGMEYKCPACSSKVYQGQTWCTCGARIDFSLPPGTVEQTTTTRVETYTTWHTSAYITYDVLPYGYYNPWDPFMNAAAFSMLAITIL